MQLYEKNKYVTFCCCSQVYGFNIQETVPTVMAELQLEYDTKEVTITETGTKVPVFSLDFQYRDIVKKALHKQMLERIPEDVRSSSIELTQEWLKTNLLPRERITSIIVGVPELEEFYFRTLPSDPKVVLGLHLIFPDMTFVGRYVDHIHGN